MKKRDVFQEVLTGIREMRAHREGKVTLRTYRVRAKPLPKVTPAFIRKTRRKFNMSRGVFAATIRVNPRTLERWEQGRSKPNEQATALLLLVSRYPETVERLEELGETP